MSIQSKIGPKDEGARWGLRLWGPEWQGGTSRGPSHSRCWAGLPFLGAWQQMG